MEIDSDAESVIEFPVGINFLVSKFKEEKEEKIKYHISTQNSTPIPIFNSEGVPFDVKSTLASTIECPLRFLSKEPPDMVLDNYCFVVDGSSVPVDSITSGEFWKTTSVATRFYCSENRGMRKFKKVHCVFCHNELKAAFGNREKQPGMKQIPLKFIFRVSRYFCYWWSCKSFHRIVSIISPVTDEGHKLFNFNKRIFNQYIWRSENKKDRRRVADEYKKSMTVSSKNQLGLPSTAINRRFSTIVRKLSSEILEESPSFL